MNLYSIEMLARERQRQLLDEAAHDRLAREIGRQTNGAYRDRRTPRTSIGLGALYARLRTRIAGSTRPTMTQEPAG
jgi:hypothetical protein